MMFSCAARRCGLSLVFCTALTTLPSVAWAQVVAVGLADADGLLPVQQVPSVVITSARTGVDVRNALPSVTVIDRNDILRSQATSLQEVLRDQAGLSLYNSGGLGKVTDLSMRGVNFGQVKVLVDGVPVNAPDSGQSGLEFLPPALVERIEIVRGPFSSLYGSDAIGGVVQIFTLGHAQNTTTPAHTEVGLTLGSYATRGVDALISQPVGGDGWYTLATSARRTRGFPSCVPDTSAGCYVSEVRDAGDDNRTLSLRVGQRLSDASRVEAHVLYTRDDTQYNGTYTDQSLITRTQTGLQWQTQTAVGWDMSWSIDRIAHRSENSLGTRWVNTFAWKNDKVSWQNNVQLGDGQRATLGLDWLRERADDSDSNSYQDKSRRTTGVFGQYLLDAGAWHTQASARRDRSDQYGHVTTGSLLGGYDLSDTLRATLSYGTAFRAPGFVYLYYPNYSNPDLLPERSRTLDLGLSARAPAQGIEAEDWSWRWHVYDTRIRDLIVSTADTQFVPYNIGAARILGTELEGRLRLDEWTLAGNVTWLRAREESPGANFGRRLPNRAGRIATLTLDHPLDAFTSAGATLHAEGSRMDYTAGTHALPGYGTLDLRVRRALNPNLTLLASLQNVLDRYYQTVYQYNTPGRTFNLSLRYLP